MLHRLTTITLPAILIACVLLGGARPAGPALTVRAIAAPVPAIDQDLLALPAVGDHRLRVLAPSLLELSLVTTEKPGGRPERWDFVGADGARLPQPARFRVDVDGTEDSVV